jgi:tRNA(Ile)-lysidine synthase
MRRKNLIVKRKAKKNLTIKDPQIKKFYTKFKNIVFKNIKNESFAIGVSGGSDSLCLAYFSKIYASEFNNKIYFLIVDHKLRKESQKESLKVKKILSKKEIKSTILNWKGKIPKSNIQLNARNIRYSLISRYCLRKKIKNLIVAHHMDDQIENFFIRLFRGSGLTGLSSMSDKFEYSKNLRIIRPFLNFKKEDLKHVTQKYFKTYIQDPSNNDKKYLRIKIRKYRKNLEDEGLDDSKIIKTINNLNSANKALNYYKNQALCKHVSFLSKNECLINKKLFGEEASEVIFKCFSAILSLISSSYYPPRSKKIINLIHRVKKVDFIKSTLGGCTIEKQDNFISISRELRVKKKPYQPQK